MEELVCKSKGCLHMNLSNPKGESFDVERTDCGGGGRSKSASLKETLVVVFSQGITQGFFNLFN